MKNLVWVLFIATLAMGIAGIDAQSCTNGYRVPNFFNFKTYYQCNNDYWIMQSCPPNTSFDFTSSECHGSGVLKTASSSISKLTRGTSQSVIPASGCTEGQIFLDKLDKNTFYVCHNGYLRAVIYTPGMTLCASEKCRENGNCGCGNLPHGSLVPSGNPTMYYACINGVLNIQLCSSGLIFNSILGYCAKQ